MLYTSIVLITILISYGISFAIYTTGAYSLLYASLAPIIGFVYVFAIFVVLALINRLLPKSCFNHNKKVFQVKKKELKFLDKLKIKRWKDKIPELGYFAGFSKKNIDSLDASYIEKFMYETCYAEVLHVVTAILGLSVVFFFLGIQILFILPIVIANTVLHIIPCFVQRYNRHRLEVVFKFKSRRSQGETPATANT